MKCGGKSCYNKGYPINLGGVTIKEILMVEDDRALSNGVGLAFQNENITMLPAYDIASAKLILEEKTVDLIILDVNLPDGSGLDFLKEIRTKYEIPIIFLTANDLETDIVMGLELGADDYITKPFSLAILRARVRTQLRKQESENSFVQNNFLFNFGKLEFYKNEQAIELSKTEQKLLKILVDNKGTTIERNRLLERIWSNGADYVDENALSVAMKRLRDKLEDSPSKPQFIKTVYGVGYTWVVK